MNILVVLTLILTCQVSCIERIFKDNRQEYDIINYYLSRTNPPCLCSGYPIVDSGYSKIHFSQDDTIMLKSKGFNSDEIARFLKNEKVDNSRKISRESILNRQVISADTVFNLRKNGTIWKYLKNQYSADGYSTISFPEISDDGRKAILKVETYTEFGESGAIYFLQKAAEGWSVLQIEMWDN